MTYHQPVLLNEVNEFLDVTEGMKIIDCTLGDGGHTVEFLKKGAFVLGIDYDSNSLETALERISSLGLSDRFTGVSGNFKDIFALATANGFVNVDGILYDLGYSSSQLENTERGISFLSDSPLDMRIDQNMGVTAADLVNTLSEKQLAQLFREYGEEHLAKRFSETIVRGRSLKKIQTTKQLADLLVSEASSGYDSGKSHPAMRVFQALRIVVNDELGNLKNSLPQAVQLLKLPGGRMAIISFHSLEDREVKNFGHEFARPDESESKSFYLESLIKKPITPSEEEVKANRKSRSAKMRVFELKLINAQ